MNKWLCEAVPKILLRYSEDIPLPAVPVKFKWYILPVSYVPQPVWKWRCIAETETGLKQSGFSPNMCVWIASLVSECLEGVSSEKRVPNILWWWSAEKIGHNQWSSLMNRLKTTSKMSLPLLDSGGAGPWWNPCDTDTGNDCSVRCLGSLLSLAVLSHCGALYKMLTLTFYMLTLTLAVNISLQWMFSRCNAYHVTHVSSVC